MVALLQNYTYFAPKDFVQNFSLNLCILFLLKGRGNNTLLKSSLFNKYFHRWSSSVK